MTALGPRLFGSAVFPLVLFVERRCRTDLFHVVQPFLAAATAVASVVVVALVLSRPYPACQTYLVPVLII